MKFQNLKNIKIIDVVKNIALVVIILSFFVSCYYLIFNSFNVLQKILIPCSNCNNESNQCSNCEIVNYFKENNLLYTAWIICISLITVTTIICFTIAVCKCIQSKKEKCNSYDEALTEMLTKKSNEQKEEKNNNEQNKD